MQNKDKDDGIEDSPLNMLRVILLEEASKEVVVVVTPSSEVKVLIKQPLYSLQIYANLKE